MDASTLTGGGVPPVARMSLFLATPFRRRQPLQGSHMEALIGMERELNLWVAACPLGYAQRTSKLSASRGRTPHRSADQPNRGRHRP
jgi:hypothetical protein